MSEDFTVCTPPFTPPQYEGENLTFDSYSFNSNNVVEADSITKHCSFRWFNCVGEAKQDVEFSEDSFLAKNEEGFLLDEINQAVAFYRSCEMGKVELFGHSIDKGASLLLDFDVLFKFALCEFMALDSQLVSTTAVALKTNATESHSIDVCVTRKALVKFFLFIREYVLQMVTSSSADNDSASEPLLAHMSHAITDQMNRFRRLMRRLVDLPEYICNHAAKGGQACGALNSSHHIFHCHLDVRWLHLTTLLLILKAANQHQRIQTDHNQRLIGEDTITNPVGRFTAVLTSVKHLTSDLIQLALLRFVKLSPNETLKQSAFNCACVQQLWILLRLLLLALPKTSNCDISENDSISFWTIVNKILFQVCETNKCNTSTDNRDKIASKSLYLNFSENYSCSSPNVFCVWLLKSLSYVFKYNNEKIEGNFELLEKILKDELKVEQSENHLRLLVPFVHSLVIDLWAPRNDPIVILWEYYQKRLNSSFYVPGTTLESLTVVPKYADKLISQVNDRLRDEKQVDSFQQFVRLLGLHLQRTNDDKKFWNQLKGRIYSKFPASKMISLTELGIYHFVSLFLTIAVVKCNEISEVCKKLQEFLNFTNKEDPSVCRLVFLTHVAILELLARNQLEFSACATPLLACLNGLDPSVSENVHQMTSLIDSLRPFLSVDRIPLGVPKLIGDWVFRYLTISNREDASRLVYYLNSLLLEMKSTNRVLGAQEVDTFESLWAQIKPLITNENSRTGNNNLDGLGSLCGSFALVSTKVYRSAVMLREVASIFSSSAGINVKTLREFLTSLIEYKPLPMALQDHDTFIIKSWLRCELLCSRFAVSGDSSTDNLSVYVRGLPDCKTLNLKFENKEPVIVFCEALRTRYMSIGDLSEKKNARDKAVRYFNSLKQWLEPVVKTVDDSDLVKRMYMMVGHIVDDAGVFVYEKGQSCSILQGVIDLLLLPPAVRRPGFKMQSTLLAAVKDSLNLFVEGLVKLGIEGDAYLSKVIQDLIVFYLPQCVDLGRYSEFKRPFSLMKSFRSTLGESRNIVMKSILETVRINFVKPRVRMPSHECRQCIKFLQDTLVVNNFESAVLRSMFAHVLGNVCSIIMYADDSSPVKRQAADLMLAIFDCAPIRADPQLGEEVMKMFSSLCQEHLAFSSRQLFALFNVLCSSGPDFVYRFFPKLSKYVEEVESKRGIGHDRALRAELDNLGKTLNFSK